MKWPWSVERTPEPPQYEGFTYTAVGWENGVRGRFFYTCHICGAFTERVSTHRIWHTTV